MKFTCSVLILSFLPFRGRMVNGSTTLAAALAANPPKGLCVAHETLPVYWDAPGQLLPLFRAHYHPDIIVGFGEHGDHLVLFERMGKNRTGGPDERNQAADAPVIHECGEFVRFSKLPFDQRFFRRESVPVRESFDAGDYLCNRLLYEGLGAMPEHFGFIHVPIQGDEDETIYLGRYFEPVKKLLRQISPSVS